MGENEEKKIEQAQEPPKKGKRDGFRERFAKGHPDVNMDDEEAYYDAVGKDYDELDDLRSSNDKLNNMFLESPQSAYFMNDLLDGKNIGESLIRHFGKTFKDAIDDPSEENVKAFAEALDAHAEKIKEGERLEEEFEKNLEASQKLVEDWGKQHKATPEQQDAVRDFIIQQFQGLIQGKVTPELLDFAWKGMNYDKDVAAAEENGTAAGKNAKIKEQLRKSKSDGIPNIQGGAKPNRSQRPGSIFDLANAAR